MEQAVNGFLFAVVFGCHDLRGQGGELKQIEGFRTCAGVDAGGSDSVWSEEFPQTVAQSFAALGEGPGDQPLKDGQIRDEGGGLGADGEAHDGGGDPRGWPEGAGADVE